MASVLPDEHGAVHGEHEQHGLRGAEHDADGDHGPVESEHPEEGKVMVYQGLVF